jgi:hypothetical protein
VAPDRRGERRKSAEGGIRIIDAFETSGTSPTTADVVFGDSRGPLAPPEDRGLALATSFDPQSSPKLISIREAAQILKVSECWVRRHKLELPMVRIGRLIRFDEALLKRELTSRIPREKPLKLRGEQMSYQIRRWQQGSVYKTGKRVKMWYGIWREDVTDAEGNVRRRQRNIKLGPVAELPTKAAARQPCYGTSGLRRNPRSK